MEEWSLSRTVQRRGIIQAGGLLLGGLGAAALVGCGGDDDNEPAAHSASPTGTAGNATAAIEGDGRFPYNLPASTKDPKRGGTLVQAVTWNLGPMDPTKSAAGGTIGPARGRTTASCATSRGQRPSRCRSTSTQTSRSRGKWRQTG
jgi:hypothetical protein